MDYIIKPITEQGDLPAITAEEKQSYISTYSMYLQPIILADTSLSNDIRIRAGNGLLKSYGQILGQEVVEEKSLDKLNALLSPEAQAALGNDPSALGYLSKIQDIDDLSLE